MTIEILIERSRSLISGSPVDICEMVVQRQDIKSIVHWRYEPLKKSANFMEIHMQHRNSQFFTKKNMLNMISASVYSFYSDL